MTYNTFLTFWGTFGVNVLINAQCAIIKVLIEQDQDHCIYGISKNCIKRTLMNWDQETVLSCIIANVLTKAQCAHSNRYIRACSCFSICRANVARINSVKHNTINLASVYKFWGT